MTIRPATANDIVAIADIQRKSLAASQWEPADYLQHACTVCETSGTVQAFLVVRTIAPEENEILNLAVAPAARRRGFARALLQNAFSSRPGTWFLEVRESNRGALELYQNLGFTEVGTRRGYYQDGPQNSPESAIVMRFQSC